MATAYDLSAPRARTAERLLWAAALAAIAVFAIYKVHDIGEPFAFGHPRWSDSYIYWFARAHLDLGLAVTLGLNVEGITATGQPIFYLSHPPLAGLVQAFVTQLLGGEHWTVRPLPLLCNLINSGLIAALAHRLAGARAAPLAVLLFLGMPFIIEYGASSESYQVYAMTAGLSGYLVYLNFLESRRWSILALACAFFAVGMGFTWLAGFMAAVMLAHLWLQTSSLSDKVRATLLAGAILGATALVLLMQQGLATGDFLYPFKRALERSHAPAGSVITWGEITRLQASRYFNYYGPLTTALTLYWLGRRILPRPVWRPVDTWVVLIWVPGLVYGFLLRDVAHQHDFLMLGLAPGAALMATLGLLQILQDASRVAGERQGPRLMWGMLALLLTVHAMGAVRSAQNFENQEAQDLESGASRMAFHLSSLPENTLLAADPTARMALEHDDRDGHDYVSLLPYLDYQVRRPVRAADDLAALQQLACEASRSGRPLVLLQTGISRSATHLALPASWVESIHRFDQTHAIQLAPAASAPCAATR